MIRTTSIRVSLKSHALPSKHHNIATLLVRRVSSVKHSRAVHTYRMEIQFRIAEVRGTQVSEGHVTCELNAQSQLTCVHRYLYDPRKSHASLYDGHYNSGRAVSRSFVPDGIDTLKHPSVKREFTSIV